MISPAVIMKLKSVLRQKKYLLFWVGGVVSQSYAPSLDKKSNTYCHASCVSVCLCECGTQRCADIWAYMFIA